MKIESGNQGGFLAAKIIVNLAAPFGGGGYVWATSKQLSYTTAERAGDLGSTRSNLWTGVKIRNSTTGIPPEQNPIRVLNDIHRLLIKLWL